MELYTISEMAHDKWVNNLDHAKANADRDCRYQIELDVIEEYLK